MLQQNDSINLVSISQYSNKQKKRYGQQSFNLKKKNHVGKKNHGHTDYIDSQYSHSQHTNPPPPEVRYIHAAKYLQVKRSKTQTRRCIVLLSFFQQASFT